jgi:hypothetical protein
MADTKISQLPAATTPLSGAEVVPLVQSGATVQTPVNEISKLVTETANTFTAANTFSAVQTFTASPIISVTDNTNAALRVTQLGTGNAILVEDSANPDSSPFVVTAAGDVGLGVTPTIKLDMVGEFLIRGAAAAGSVFRVTPDATGSNGVILDTSFITGGLGPLIFKMASSERMRIDSSGNVLVTGAGGLGYGTGSGGTVTQLTNKNTGVTINKTNGQIVTASGSITAGTPANFVVTNSTVAATDTIIVHRASGGTASAYTIGCDSVAAGSFRVYIDNLTGSAINEVLTLSFSVIKAVTS